MLKKRKFAECEDAQDSAATIIKTYGRATYSSALWANLGKPHCLRVPSMTALAFWSEIPSSLFCLSVLGQFRQAHNQHSCFISSPSSQSWWVSRIYSLCSNWDCCQFMDPWSNRITRFPIGRLVFCSNLRLTGKLTKITALMTHNQSRPYEELIGWYFIWEIPLHTWHTVCPCHCFLPKRLKPCL